MDGHRRAGSDGFIGQCSGIGEGVPLGTLRIDRARHCCAQLPSVILGVQLTTLISVTKLHIRSEGMVRYQNPGFTAESMLCRNTPPLVHRRCQRQAPVPQIWPPACTPECARMCASDSLWTSIPEPDCLCERRQTARFIPLKYGQR